ncbi:MAG: GFA family protein [Pseudomonadales bacterium]|nr:GFA family protein [Pseudomonadales bacterium]
MNNMQIDGHCHCGKVTYAAEISETRTFVCHCTDCQQFSGSAFRVRTVIPSANFKITSGSPRTYSKTSETGTERIMHFCEFCGTHLFGSGTDITTGISLSTTTATQKNEIMPMAQVWCQSKLPWIEALGSLRQIEKQAFGKG